MCAINFAEEAFGSMDWNLYTKIIDEGAKNGLASIKLNWRGEPLLHPKIVEMVKYAKDKGIVEVQFNTNAQLLTEDLSRRLIDAGLDRIIFSVDGATTETYEKIRRGGKYDRLVNNIETFLRLKKEKGTKLPLTRIQFVKMKENENEADLFKKTWDGKIDEVIVNPFLDYTSLSDTAEKQDNLKSSDQIKITGRKPCNQLWQRLIISYDGEVMMCCDDWNMEVKLGNVNNQNIYDIWHGEKLNKIRKLHATGQWDNIPVCKNCTELDGCTYEKNEN
jgi:radical SAM protein with 4Fe4S-binding SPASM domain|tara:strand:+ start:1336 stop:2163 length:828 start_codon:yes stop_codon:yes gene_type:complete